MAIHPQFPLSPYEIVLPEYRWIPSNESLKETPHERLLPPLVHALRKKVFTWREEGYPGISKTSNILLNWWFGNLRNNNNQDESFDYYFAQREAVETVIFLTEYINVIDKNDLLRFDNLGVITLKNIEETWRRYVIKMATGSGKTKVISLLLTWSYFHKKYEENSELSTNFLIIAPNIIVLDRLKSDFEGLKIFSTDPVLPDDGFENKNWKSDFQLTIHLQDDIHILNSLGNIFLTNIHRLYEEKENQLDEDDYSLDYFVGKKPKIDTNTSKTDLGKIIRDIDELVIFNDEAHHIHDSKLSWFKSIGDIHNKLVQKNSKLSLQIDVTATPKHNNGAIFAQTISDYPLVEAITQNVVKRPVLPDEPSRNKLSEVEESSEIEYTKKYSDFLNLGVVEWRKSFEQHQKLGKKAVLFVMTDDTKNCDEVAKYLELNYPEFKDAVLTIHTNRSGEISEKNSTKASKEELIQLRKQSNEIDKWSSPYKAIVSVLMLKEGWDVQNVTTIVGLRAYSSPARILPEQTLGRGLRRMYRNSSSEEYVSVVGTRAFLEFVEAIQTEGVELERRAMGEGTPPIVPLIVEVDSNNPKKNIDKLDISIPILNKSINRDYRNFNDINLDLLDYQPALLKKFTEKEKREIVFRDFTTDEVTHTTTLEDSIENDYRGIIGFLTQTILKELRIQFVYDLIYPKVQEFIEEKLFGKKVDLNDSNTLRNLQERKTNQLIVDTFKKGINNLTIQKTSENKINDYIKIKETRPFTCKDQKHLNSKKSVFNKIVGDNGLELRFAQFLERSPDVISYSKIYYAINYKIPYIDNIGAIANYYPDFVVQSSNGKNYIIETKGRVDIKDPLKINGLKEWCKDVNSCNPTREYDFIFVDQEKFDKLSGVKSKRDNVLATFNDLIKNFNEYKD